MTSRRFQQVDVFTAVPTRGNPVAVVLDGDGLTDDEMQATARWTNLSETTFVLPPTEPTADYRLRIFTPGAELGFAGHPTLGTCHAWLAAGGAPGDSGEIVQQGNVGLVRLRRRDGHLAFAAPPSHRRDPDPDVLTAVLAALGLADGLPAQVLDNGTEWLAVRVADAATVLALEPDHAALADLPKIGVVGPHPSGSEAAIEVRAFAASVGITEDPVTGSLQASVAQWLTETGVLPARYVAAQGTRVGRTGRVHVDVEAGEVWVGGGTHTVISGSIDL
jgi:PhzF family phenazine biosynthesis protein